MIPINNLQAKIYQALKGVGVKVYDEVQEGATMPLISIGDYILSSLEFKDNSFSFNWTINIYTEYEGKKEVNNLLSKALGILKGLDNTKINEFYIDSVWLDNANVFRNEGYYVADINMKFLIMEV